MFAFICFNAFYLECTISIIQCTIDHILPRCSLKGLQIPVKPIYIIQLLSSLQTPLNGNSRERLCFRLYLIITQHMIPGHRVMAGVLMAAKSHLLGIMKDDFKTVACIIVSSIMKRYDTVICGDMLMRYLGYQTNDNIIDDNSRPDA